MRIIKRIETYFLAFLTKIMPVKKERMLFTAFKGHYSDNPKYICEKIYELNHNAEMIWLVHKQYINNLPKYVKAVDIGNKLASAYYRGTSKVVVDNGDMGADLYSNKFLPKLGFMIFTFLCKKKNQKYYTTWHGTPLKRMRRHQVGSTIIDYECADTTMILGNKFTLNIMKDLMFDKIATELIGTPRNDILFRDESRRVELKKKIGLPLDKNIILFAPTFRDDSSVGDGRNVFRSGINQLRDIDFNILFKTLSEKFGNEWVIVCRFHYYVEEMVDWERLQKEYPGKFINGNEHEDMAEYLACTDVLLTDASSSMFDFMLTKKPCFLFFPDLEYYKNQERGFYRPIEELPFPVSVDFEGLIENIKNFDEESYKADVEKLIEEFGYVDDADSSERVARYILDEMNKK